MMRTRGDEDVVNEAIVQTANGFDLLFVHLPQVDLMRPRERLDVARVPGAAASKPTRPSSRLVASLPAGDDDHPHRGPRRPAEVRTARGRSST